jgi:ferrochelatase
MTDKPYDALLVVSFGGPESRDDVMPFLENVLRGKPVPRERMLEVAEHYYHFGGVSPINSQLRELIAVLEAEFQRHQIDLPIYWGNRNWHPFLSDTVRQMVADGRRRTLAYVTSAYSSYSGCRQYRENIAAACAEAGQGAPQVDKLRMFYNHPGFIEATAARVRAALDQFPGDKLDGVQLLFTAHSIPLSMSETCDYVRQLRETAELVSQRLGRSQWQLVYQSRSGPPQQPWLEPDVREALRQGSGQPSLTGVVIAPIGFLSDHLEVLYDLDVEARQLCDELPVPMVRAGTVGTHPRFVEMIRELVEERLNPSIGRLAIGRYGPSHDVCPANCCPPLANRPPMHLK